jgi:hypothetical protein
LKLDADARGRGHIVNLPSISLASTLLREEKGAKEELK